MVLIHAMNPLGLSRFLLSEGECRARWTAIVGAPSVGYEYQL